MYNYANKNIKVIFKKNIIISIKQNNININKINKSINIKQVFDREFMNRMIFYSD